MSPGEIFSHPTPMILTKDSRDSSESKHRCFDLIVSNAENVASQVYVEENKSKFLQLNFSVEHIYIVSKTPDHNITYK